MGRPVREIVGWKQPGKTIACWDLRIDCDGHRWKDRHYAAGQAQAAKELLESAFRKGHSFDPTTKRFVEPDQLPDAPTVFSETLAWWRAHWSIVEPKSRKETLRYICRPIRELVRSGATTPGGVDAYLTWQLVPPKAPDTPVPAEHAEAAAWLKAASLPVAEADVATWQAYVDRWRVNSRTGRPLAPASLNRHLVDIRQMWGWVCALHELPDPWRMVQANTRSSAGRRNSSTVRPVDRRIVLAPKHVRELAALCGEGGFGPLAEVYVLLLGLGGGRPGESAGVEVRDLHFPATGVGEIRFKKTHRRGIDAVFLDADDDPEWGPLKGREIQEARSVPIPSGDAHRIGELLKEVGTVAGPLFPEWDWDKFGRDVWVPAKELMVVGYADGSSDDEHDDQERAAVRSALSRLRLHDLRHAACSMWLNTPDVEVRVACEWSGHKRLSVFLDIYQGIMPGSQESAKERLDAAWPR
jgi:integrase